MHKFVLHQHSAYFRAYFQSLPVSSPRRRPAKRAKRSRSAAVDEAKPCDHVTAHCIHLPQQSRLVEKTAVTAADFRLFLCYLYFSAHYCYPPFLPKTDVALGGDEAEADTTIFPVSLSFPPVPYGQSIDWHESKVLRLTDKSGEPQSNEAVLTLAHYLDCTALMKQCDDVLVSKVMHFREMKAKADGEWEEHECEDWIVERCWHWLPYCDRYRLASAKEFFMSEVAEDQWAMSRHGYEVAKKTWERSLLVEVMDSIIGDWAR